MKQTYTKRVFVELNSSKLLALQILSFSSATLFSRAQIAQSRNELFSKVSRRRLAGLGKQEPLVVLCNTLLLAREILFAERHKRVARQERKWRVFVRLFWSREILLCVPAAFCWRVHLLRQVFATFNSRE